LHGREAALARRTRYERTRHHIVETFFGSGTPRMTRCGRAPSRAARTASRSGSRSRLSHVRYHSHAAPHVGHESSIEPFVYGSDSIGDESYGHCANSIRDSVDRKAGETEARDRRIGAQGAGVNETASRPMSPMPSGRGTADGRGWHTWAPPAWLTTLGLKEN
jgi:hypothetical protein